MSTLEPVDCECVDLEQSSETDGSNKRRAVVLVVEDDLSLREFMKTCLEMEGFEVIAAANGLDGLQMYEKNRHQVEVVVTDLEMPMMNGSDMIRQIFTITPAMKILVASGQCARYTQTMCLQKPYTARELTEAVRLLL
jgi:CheY-like chemotaxis protein